MCVVAQQSRVPYLNDFGPGYEVKDVSYPYPGSYRPIREIDFRNLKVLLGGQEGLRLRNGLWQPADRFDHRSLLLLALYNLPSSSPGTEFAVAFFKYWTCGGSCSSGGRAELFAVSGDALRVLQEIDWDTDAARTEANEWFDPASNVMVVRASHYMPGDAHCCISAMDIVTLRWTGRRFVTAGVKTVLSRYGKNEHKKLYP
jgi:hypothetical protein